MTPVAWMVGGSAVSWVAISAAAAIPIALVPRTWFELVQRQSSVAVLVKAQKARRAEFSQKLGLIEEAAVSAAAMPQTAERVHEMQIAILASTAVFPAAVNTVS